MYNFFSLFSVNPVYVSTYDNTLMKNINSQFDLVSGLINVTTTGILCEKGKLAFLSTGNLLSKNWLSIIPESPYACVSFQLKCNWFYSNLAS